MNDFTKEELEELKYFLFGNPKSSVELCRKIQSMIDNYDCKHDWSIQLNDDYIPISGEICTHCGTEKR